MFKYTVIIQWSAEDEGYIATVSELPGVSAFGETAEEAAREVEDAAAVCIESLDEDGKPIPSPKLLEEYSGQFRVRVSKSLHQQLARRAEIEGVSLNLLINNFLTRGVSVDYISTPEERRVTEGAVNISTTTNVVGESVVTKEGKLNIKSDEGDAPVLRVINGGV